MSPMSRSLATAIARGRARIAILPKGPMDQYYRAPKAAKRHSEPGYVVPMTDWLDASVRDIGLLPA